MPHPPRVQDWIIADGSDPAHRDDSANGLGTCVASKALGVTGGVSKSSSLVIVKANKRNSGLVSAYVKIIDDIIQKGRQRKAVIVHTSGSVKQFKPQDLYTRLPEPWEFIRGRMKALRDLGVPIVVAAGNDARRSRNVDTLPALFGTETSSRRPRYVIPASAVGLQGQVAYFTQISPPLFRDMWAPGVSVSCAQAGSGTRYERRNGTFVSAPMVRANFGQYYSTVRERFPVTSWIIGQHVLRNTEFFTICGISKIQLRWNEQEVVEVMIRKRVVDHIRSREINKGGISIFVRSVNNRAPSVSSSSLGIRRCGQRCRP